MASPYKPTIASANTGAPVKGHGMLAGPAQPLQTYSTGSQPHGNPHVNTGPQAFATPQKVYGTSPQGHVQNKEMRGGVAPAGITQGIVGHDNVPHIKMV